MKKLALVGIGLAPIVAFIAAAAMIVVGIMGLGGNPPKCYPDAQNGGGNVNNVDFNPGGDLAKNAVGDGEDKIPKKAIPWINKLSDSGKYKYPAWFVAGDMFAESTFNPTVFSGDKNGGTWGLVQINETEWNRVYGSKSWSEDRDKNGVWDIKDPLIHAEYAAKLWDEQIDQIHKYKQTHPKSGAAKASDLELLLVSHNAGFGRVQTYPSIPSSTRETYIPRIAKMSKLWGGDLYTTNVTANPGNQMFQAQGTANTDSGSAATALKDRTYKLPKVNPTAKKMGNLLGNKYQIKTIGGWRASATDPKGHPSGNALDFMIDDIKDGSSVGDRLAADAVSNAKDYSVEYVIWEQKLYASYTKWKPRKMSDRGSKTENHFDHVHINFKPGGKTPDSIGNDDGAGGGSVQNVDAKPDTGSGGSCDAINAGSQQPAGPGSKAIPKGRAKEGGVQLDNTWQYYQGDAPWADVDYRNRLAESGCGPTTMASVLTTFYPDNPFTPADSAAYFMSHGGRAEFGSNHIWKESPMQKQFKFKSESVTPSASSARRGIKAGGLVVISVRSGTPFTGGGHIMMIRGIKGDKFLVGTSSGRGKESRQNQNYAAQDTGVFKFGDSNGTWNMDIITPTGQSNFKPNVQ